MRTFQTIANHRWFINTIIGLILFNAVLLGFETVPRWYSVYFSWFHLLDQLLLWLFTVEIVIRLLAYRKPWEFFKDGWNIFDFVIVASGHILTGAQFVTVLRILRLLRVLRAFSVIPSLRKMVNALLRTIPALGNILLLMGLIFYIFGIAGTVLFREASPEFFGSLGKSLLTLFQVVTLESWASGVMRPLLTMVPWAWAYFVIFVLVGTFVVFNLFVGVIVNNVDKVEEEERKALIAKSGEPSEEEHRKLVTQELKELRTEMASIHQLLTQQHKNK